MFSTKFESTLLSTDEDSPSDNLYDNDVTPRSPCHQYFFFGYPHVEPWILFRMLNHEKKDPIFLEQVNYKFQKNDP